MEKNPTMLFVVAAALTNQDGEILLQKRPEGRQMAGLWEFPGGKVDVGESPESALVRELQEELGIDVLAENLVPITFASEPLGDRNLLLLLYRCTKWQGEPLRSIVQNCAGCFQRIWTACQCRPPMCRWCARCKTRASAFPMATKPMPAKLCHFLAARAFAVGAMVPSR